MPVLDAKLDLPSEGFVRLSQFLGPWSPDPCWAFYLVRRDPHRALPSAGAPWTSACGMACRGYPSADRAGVAMTALPHGYSEADTKPSDAVVAKSTVCVGGASRLASQHTESIQISASTRPPVSATSPFICQCY
jgi:hypothetical protein